MNRTPPILSGYFVFLAGLALLLALLACNAPTWDEVTEPLDLPTPAPSPAPNDAPPAANESNVLSGAGVKISFAVFEDASCLVDAPMILTVRSDGSAELSATSPTIQDHINCTASSSNETWIVSGTFQPADQTVTFASCNYGGFTAQGLMKLNGTAFTGEVSCFTKDGKKSITLRVE